MFLVKNITLLLLYLTVCSSLVFEDECVDSASGLSGKCELFEECNYTYKYRKEPEYCSDDNNVIICCPPVQLRISEQMCLEYHFDSDNDDDNTISVPEDHDDRKVPGPHIVGGTPADLREYRHMAAIGFTQDYKIEWNCGGTIISPLLILSAAHCAKYREFGQAKWVRIGDLDLADNTKGANHQDLRIVQYFKHPDYISTRHYINDIALFKLEKEINFGYDYKPACLHTEREVPKIMEAVGWGQTEYENCARNYRNEGRLPNGIMNETQICAGDVSGKDTCMGESGGPLHYKLEFFFKLSEHYVVAGVVSFAKGCGSLNTASVYTRVSAYVEWIEKIGKIEDKPEIEE